MKYRIKKMDNKFYPQYKNFWNLYMWVTFMERYTVRYPESKDSLNIINDAYGYISFDTLEKADEYLEKKKKENEVIIYKR